jgi:hypothetical protein
MGSENEPHFGEESGQEPLYGEEGDPQPAGGGQESTATSTSEATQAEAETVADDAAMRPTGSGGSAPPSQ